MKKKNNNIHLEVREMDIKEFPKNIQKVIKELSKALEGIQADIHIPTINKDKWIKVKRKK